MSSDDRTLLDAVLRNDLASFTQRVFQTVVPGQRFLPNWHIEAIAHQLERCRRGEIRRLIITVPPRYLKSICASVAFPAFALGHDPSLRILCASYSQELAAKHSRDCRAVIESGWYRELFRRTRIDPRKNTEGEFETTARGYRFSTSVGGTLTGRGGNLILIDDPAKPDEVLSDTKRRAVNAWYDSTLSTRLDDKTRDAIVLIMQRLHVDDLVGHVLEQADDWTHLNLPAVASEDQVIDLGHGVVHRRARGDLLHPEREPQEELDKMQRQMGSHLFSAQYNQAPVPPGGNLIRQSWFQTYDRPPEWCTGDQIVQSWDTASKVSPTNDFSVGMTWLMRRHEYYLLDVFRDRLAFPDLLRRVRAYAERYAATAVLIEDAGSGTQLIQQLRSEGPIQPIRIQPERDKVARLEGVSAVIEAGHVIVPQQAPWLAEFLNEVLAFPSGHHDDQADSLSQFLAWALRRHRLSSGVGGRPELFEA